MTGDPLARRYRRLLWCYPRAYRRARGEELVATFLEAAPRGRARPTRREALNLLRHGLRARLGRPASRSVVLWSILAAVIGGLLAAGAGARLAWETSRPLPDAVEVAALLAPILGDRQIQDVQDPGVLFGIFGFPVGHDFEGLLVEGNEYMQSSTRVQLVGRPTVSIENTMTQFVERLRADGWSVYDPIWQPAYTCTPQPCQWDVAVVPVLFAERGDTVLWFSMDTVVSGAPFGISVFRTQPPAVVPGAIAGGLIGAALVWLAFAWVSRRTGPTRLYRVLSTVLCGITLVSWWLPVPFATIEIVRALPVREPELEPQLWEWLGQPTASLLFLIGASSGVLALALAAWPRPRLARRWPDGTQLIA